MTTKEPRPGDGAAPRGIHGTPLGAILARRIAQTGPITLADFMAECLLHPEHGYYTTREAFGTQGDFVTAPEISQMFGELAGLCMAAAWQAQGAPAPFTLAELGPGRGTLMADILRAARAAVPDFVAAARLHLVEASPRLRAAQRERLGMHDPRWCDSADDLPTGAPLFVVANEFFDALPIRQFRREAGAPGAAGAPHEAGGWRERMVGLRDGALAFGWGPPTAPAALTPRLADTAPGEIVEICPAASPVMAALSARIATAGGCALIVDYGGWHSRGDTFQAMEAHRHADPLAAPGRADLTAHVDFEALALAAPDLGRTPLIDQGGWLTRLGIGARAERLARSLSGPPLEAHLAAYRRLTHPSEMGTLFKTIAFHPPGTLPPPGFE